MGREEVHMSDIEFVSQEEVDEIMKKYDRESNTRIWEGKLGVVVRYALAAFSVFMIWMNLCATWDERIRRSIFVGLLIFFTFLIYPLRKGKPGKPNSMPWYDAILAVAGSGCFFYFALNLKEITAMATRITQPLIIIGIIGTLILAEATRRVVGPPILCVASVFVLYAFVGADMSLRSVVYNLFYTTTGILGTPIGVCSTFIFLFVLFGAYLESTGIGDFFIQLANMVCGWASGGPAKVAVIASALEGMVSGSSVANTVGSGSITIPMMKKTGYPPEFAGAVEATASTGGQIMPPIMGAAAFLMAEYMNVTYGEVALRAILPAVLYFTGIFISVHLEAHKLGLKGLERSQLPKMGKLMRKIYLLTPLVVLVWLVTTNTRTMQFSASIAIVCAIVVSLFDKDNRITVPKILEALEAGGKSAITVAVACSIAGVISGCITATGLASKLISAVVSVSNSVSFVDPTFVALFLTMICCIVLGMGVPTTANYCIMASTCAPILITIGVPKMAAHFFVFYFGIVADITPPVALAAYAGSAIAKSNPMKTGINATKLAIAAFIVPYIFCMNPAMLLIDVTVWSMIQIIITSLVGLFGVAAALEGYLLLPMNPLFRIACAVGGILMMIPGTFTDVIGIALFAAVAVIQLVQKKNAAAVA